MDASSSGPPAVDPAIAAIVEAFEASGQPYLIVNEHHEVDWHRHVSACILDAVSARRPMMFGGENIPQAFHTDFGTLRVPVGVFPAYRASPFYQHIWRVAIRYDLPVFGYDQADTELTDAELVAQGVQVDAINRRERTAAEYVLQYTAPLPDHGVYLHVGFAHASETINFNPEGMAGWLAGHLRMITGEDPVTVYQLAADRWDWYEERGRFEFNPEACAAMENKTVVVRSHEGVIGCVDRALMPARQDVDFLWLDPVEPGPDPDLPEWLCPAWRADYDTTRPAAER